jgi:hypothetical protein
VSPKVSIPLLIAHWAERLAAAELAYTTNRTAETRAEYKRVLQILTRLVVNDKIPEEES